MMWQYCVQKKSEGLGIHNHNLLIILYGYQSWLITLREQYRQEQAKYMLKSGICDLLPKDLTAKSGTCNVYLYIFTVPLAMYLV
jgi:hypothetical protein